MSSGPPVKPRRPRPGRSLLARYPAIAREWHPTKNGALSADDVAPTTLFRAWWRCRRDPSHEWTTLVVARTGSNSACPFCVGRRASADTSFRAVHPEMAREWHPTKNGRLTPDDVRPGAQRRIWWRCVRDPSHEWQAYLNSRTQRRDGCPYCSGRRATARTSLAALHPDVVREWHPTKNGALDPERLRPGTSRSAWWRCRKDASHEWRARVNHRVEGQRCPMCAGKVVTPATSLAARVPDVAKQWHPTKNGTLGPEHVTTGTERRVWWRCARNPDHVWRARVSHRVRGQGCPHCPRKRAKRSVSLQRLRPALAREWHPNKNGELTAGDVSLGSSRIVWWRCRKEAAHVWATTVASRAKQGTGCPMCAGLVATRETSLAALFPAIAREWHPKLNGELRPDQLRPGSHRRVWWQCSRKPGHRWLAVVRARVVGRGCPICSNRLVGDDNSLRAVYPRLAREWHPTKNGKLNPDAVVAGSAKRVWWRCEHNRYHEWQARIGDRGRGSGCPYCAGRHPRFRKRRRRPKLRVPIMV